MAGRYGFVTGTAAHLIASAAMDEIMVSTMNDLPGYEVVEVYGEVFGLIVRARNAFSNIGAAFARCSAARSRATPRC